MANLVCSGASMSCSYGTATSSLVILPTNEVNADSMPAATVNDYIPLVNIMTFGECSSTTNPAVIAATAAASGVQTPAPCVPSTVTPWSPGIADVAINGMSALDDGSTCDCLWAGSISFSDAGEEDVDIA
ncbi:hypothetical protein A8C32_05125 [Flavivirga aquatica]|uniref:DUF4280 domain-containing protein n=1 Tax=Flavivirga aquatica TaxID=1849968 RepID=A0A1E5SHI9_9FLAO|nr:DUF4280 domain-containing protein [Flavivirga aquatica]OEJ98585.1 hypothetical protein A8C32_05125 [Flavivirga aquatica]